MHGKCVATLSSRMPYARVCSYCTYIAARATAQARRKGGRKRPARDAHKTGCTHLAHCVLEHVLHAGRARVQQLSHDGRRLAARAWRRTWYSSSVSTLTSASGSTRVLVSLHTSTL